MHRTHPPTTVHTSAHPRVCLPLTAQGIAFLLVLLTLTSSPLQARASALRTPAPARTQNSSAEEDYRYVAGLVERELWDLAVTAGQKFLRDHPQNERAALARYRLATALFALDRHAEALPHWDRLAQKAGFEYRAEASFRAGECSLALGQAAEAVPRFAAVLQGDQAYLHEPASFLLGEASFQAEDYAAAEGAYARHIERFPEAGTVPDARRARAWCAWEQGDAAGAVERAQQFLARHSQDPALPEVGVLLGEALLETSDPAGALDVFLALPAESERRDAALRGAGFSLAALGRHEEAAQAFDQVLRDFPESGFARECRLQQGAQLVAAGRHERAVAALAPLASAGEAEACLWYGRAHEGGGDANAALRAFERGLATDPDEDLAERLHVARGDALNALGRLDEARAAYALGGSDYALHAAAVAALNSGDAREAERIAETLLKRGQEAGYRGPTLLVLGEARFQAQRWDAAEAAFSSALAAAEDDAARSRSRSRIAWCRYLSGDLAGAASGFASLGDEMPTCGEAEEAWRMAARALEEDGARSEAAQAWRAYLQRHQEGAFVTEALIALARTTTDPQERARSLARAADNDGAGREGARALLNLAEDLAEAGDSAAPARFEDLLERVAGKDAELEARARYGLAWCRFEEERFAEAGTLLAPLAQARTLDALRQDDAELAGSAVELLAWSLANADLAAESTGALQILNADGGVLLPDEARRFEVARAVAEAWRRAAQPARGQAVYAELLGSLREAEVAVRALVEGTYLSLDAGDRERAEAQLREASQHAAADPSVLEASFFVAEARLAAGEEERALALYALAARSGSPLAADALYKRGFVLLANERTTEAAPLFAELVEAHAESPLLGEALFLLGEAHFRAGAYAQAVTPLERVRTELPRHEVRPKALYRLGLALGRLERWEGAASVLSALAKETPEFPNLAEAELWRGRSLAALAQRRPARAALERVLQLDKGALAAEARVVLGNLLQDEGRHEDALSEYLKVAVLYAHPPAVSESLYRAGLSLEALERPDDAAQRYREVLSDHERSAWSGAARSALERLEGR